jgi:hypothetical protein
LRAPLQEADSSKDAELIAGTTAHFVSQEQLKNRLADIGRQMAAKQRRLAALQSAVGVGDGLKAQYDGHLQVRRVWWLGRGHKRAVLARDTTAHRRLAPHPGN